MSMDVTWWYPVRPAGGRKAHAFRDGADASVCGKAWGRRMHSVRRHRCRSCSRILGEL